MSYVAMAGDSVQSLSSRFGVSMDRIEDVNGILNLDNITAGDLLYIPLDSGKKVSIFMLKLGFLKRII